MPSSALSTSTNAANCETEPDRRASLHGRDAPRPRSCSSRSAIWICRYWRLSSCPGASGVTARPPATASGWRPRRGAGRRHPGAVDACGVVLLGSDPPPGCTASLSGGRRRVAAGRPACQRAARVLRSATALRVTHRPPRGSDGSYGPCGPAWTRASRPSTTSQGPGAPPNSERRTGPEPPARDWGRGRRVPRRVAPGAPFRCVEGGLMY